MMRRFVPFLLALLLALPASAALKIVSPTTPVTPLITGYLESTARDGTSVATVLATAAAADTVYVHTGTYNERVLYTNWHATNDNVVLLFANDGSAVMRYTNAATTYAFGAPPIGVTGAKVVNMVLDGDGNTGTLHAFLVDTARTFTIENCTVRGNFNSIMVHAVGITSDATFGANGLTVTGCDFTIDYSGGSAYDTGINFGSGGNTPGAQNITFTDTTIDMSAATVTTNGLWFRGVDTVTMNNCVVKMPYCSGDGAQAIYGLRTQHFVADAAGAEYTDNVTLTDCTFIGSSNPAASSSLPYVLVANGGSQGADGTIDDFTMLRCYLWVPALAGHGCFKAEADYETEAPGTDLYWIDNPQVHYNVAINGYVGLGFHENVRGGSMTNNLIIGPGRDIGYDSFGIIMEGVRHCTYSNNHVIETVYGIDITQSGDDDPIYENNSNRMFSNLFEKCDYAILMVPSEGVSANVVDSLLYSTGNIAMGCANWAGEFTGSLTPLTLDDWVARVIPGIPALPPWEHAVGDAEYEDDPAAMRRARVVPPVRHIGRGPAIE